MPRTTRRGAAPGHRHPRARFTAREVAELRRLAARGWSQRALAELVTERQGRRCVHTTVGKVLRGERYRD